MSFDFNRLEQVLSEAATRADLTQRSVFLDEACGRDRELRAEVERLLAAHQQAGAFLETPVQAAPEQLASDGDNRTEPMPDCDIAIERTGAMIGRYKLLEKIGEGGFGVVYLAEQAEPVQRKVALKVVKEGMDTREVVARFESERQALALMDHPGIARVFDGGVTQGGRPYFVMELVQGIAITEFCDQRRLSTPERLKLFIQVCLAVQHAHQKGIIHRDLKPSNILVTLIDGAPVPKVIDFGVAKALGQKLTEKTLFTGFLKMVGTPAYMSPEQADFRGVDIDTRADIYALGVLLYELLTGVAPFDGEMLRNAALDEIRRIIRETEPPKPSTRLQTLVAADVRRFSSKYEDRSAKTEADRASLRRLQQRKELINLVRGDLDWIVMKCLEKDRGRRYETANSLAGDIERHLNNEPVVARPPSMVYRAQKFIGRHKAGIAGVGALVSLLVGGIIVTLWQAQRANQARDLAQGRLYAAQMKLAHAAIKEGRTGGALALLGTLQPAPGEADFRGFDWRYLYRRCLNTPSEVLATNASGFQSVDFSPDSRTVAFGSSDGWVELFDVPTRRRLKRWRAHAGAVDRVGFHPTNREWLATTSGGDHIFKFWDINSEQILIYTSTAQGMQVDFAFSPGGRFLVTQGTNAQSLDLWEFRVGAPASPPMLTFISNLGYSGPAAFSPDERILALCNRIQGGLVWSVCLHDLASGSQTTLPVIHSDLIFAVAFSPDGTTLATAGVDERLVFWDVKERACFWSGRSDLIFATSLAFTPDGRTLLASGYDQNIRSWNVHNPGQIQTWPGHGSGVNRLDVAPDGHAFASASDDGTGRLWHLSTAHSAVDVLPGEPFTTLFSRENTVSHEREQDIIWAVAASPTLDHAAAAETHQLLLYDLEGGMLLTNVALTNVFSDASPVPISLAYSPDGGQLAVGTDDGRVALVDAITLRPLRKPLQLHGNQITHVAFALNGSLLATGGGFGTGVKLTEVASGQVQAEFVANEGFFPIQPLAVSRDGKRLATGASGGEVRVWDIASRRLVTSSPRKVGLVTDLAFSSDAQWLAISDARRSVFLWRLDGKHRWRQLLGHTGVAIKLVFTPDGRTLASGGMDHTIRMWHPDIDQEVAVLSGHTEWIWALAFGSDGNVLLSGGRDGTLRLWRALSFEHIRSQHLRGDSDPPQ